MEHPNIIQHSKPASKNPFSLNAFQIKLIAVIAMLLDHIAWKFLAESYLAGQGLHLVGRITAPVMCFFLTEGYHHTRNLRKYFMRLAVFALISHFAFVYFETGRFFAPCKSSVIGALLLSLMCVHVWHCAPPENAALNRDIHFGFPLHPAFRLPVIALLAFTATTCDWGIFAVLFTMTFELARRYGQKAQARAYVLASLCYIIARWNLLSGSLGDVKTRFYAIGVLLPVPLLLLYNSKRGGDSAGRFKWFFYIFYPAHLLILAFLAKGA